MLVSCLVFPLSKDTYHLSAINVGQTKLKKKELTHRTRRTVVNIYIYYIYETKWKGFLLDFYSLIKFTRNERKDNKQQQKITLRTRGRKKKTNKKKFQTGRFQMTCFFLCFFFATLYAWSTCVLRWGHRRTHTTSFQCFWRVVICLHVFSACRIAV